MVSPFGGILSVDTFMRDYWQKRPLIIPKAIKESSIRIDQDQIFEMAYDLEFHSRLIIGDSEKGSMNVEIGPIDEEYLTTYIMSLSHWTLLVQDTEKASYRMHQLLEYFRFIPNWRLDDVQLSYAEPGGSVGPHVDSYDVFLIQLAGKRKWKIETSPIAKERPMREDASLQLLKEFHPDKEFTAEPGALLYLPPKFPHWGIAVDTCITASIGFKIPEISTLQTAFTEMGEHSKHIPERFVDSVYSKTDDPGYVSDSALDWFQNEIRRLAEDREQLERIFCEVITHPVRGNWPLGVYPLPSPEEILYDLQHGATILRTTPACMVYLDFDDCTRIYALGNEYDLHREMTPFARLLTGTKELNHDALLPYLEDEKILKLLQSLMHCGALCTSKEN